MTRLRAVALALAASFAAGCGYQVGSHGDLMPSTVKTIAISAFANTSTRYKLARLLPQDIGREILSRTRYRIVEDPNQADAVLTGTVAGFSAYPTISDPVSGRATAAEAVVTVNIALKDRRTGKTLFSRIGAEYRQRYEIALDPQQYFDESGPAMERISRDVAHGVVSGILEAF
jgi:outer membrane lipopolysaccharide assembly protein LptE/RlpB